MGSKYDSVLKEEKKYEEVIDDRPFLRKHIFSISFFVCPAEANPCSPLKKVDST